MNIIKFFAITFILSSGFLSCGKLTNDEISFGKAAGLHKEDLLFIKDLTNSKIDNFATNTETIKGLKINVLFEKTDAVREQLSNYFKTRGYLVFLAKQNYDAPGLKNILGIIKSTDQYDILRIQKTVDRRKKRGKTTDTIIEQFKKWEKDFKFEITGAEFYYVEAKFISKPSDMKNFTEEITKYCPELLNDGTGKIDDLMNNMNSKNSFNLLFNQ
jgi:hypothetical protein